MFYEMDMNPGTALQRMKMSEKMLQREKGDEEEIRQKNISRMTESVLQDCFERKYEFPVEVHAAYRFYKQEQSLSVYWKNKNDEFLKSEFEKLLNDSILKGWNSKSTTGHYYTLETRAKEYVGQKLYVICLNEPKKDKYQMDMDPGTMRKRMKEYQEAKIEEDNLLKKKNETILYNNTKSMVEYCFKGKTKFPVDVSEAHCHYKRYIAAETDDPDLKNYEYRDEFSTILGSILKEYNDKSSTDACYDQGEETSPGFNRIKYLVYLIDRNEKGDGNDASSVDNVN